MSARTMMLALSLSVSALPWAFAGGTSTGLIPVTELPPAMYQGFEGGLYPGGLNTPPAAHADDILAASLQIVPRGPDGVVDLASGKIVMIAIGMSNTTHEFAPFERQEDLNAGRNARLIILDTALGGQDAVQIANPADDYWPTVTGRVAVAGATNAQVQVAWLKEAVANPTAPFPAHALSLRDNLKSIAQNLHDLFPNLRLLYVSSRIYAGYATGSLNPEPFAYESAFSVKWLIEDQINGDPGLNFDPDVGPVESPVLAWGPYLWADGLVPRGDGLIWELADFEADGTHPAPSGEQKVADMLSVFFENHPSAGPWWDASPGATLASVNTIADATVDSAAPTTNFGIHPQVQSSNARRGYLKFDVSGVTAPILCAKLSLRNNAYGGGVLSLASDTSWSETGITWSSAPPADGGIVHVMPRSSRDGTFAADVTGAVNTDADGIVTFVLATDAGSQSYISKDGGQPPRLILTLAAPPPPCLGDADGNGVVNFGDVTSVLANFGNVYPSGDGPGDANHNGVVNFADVTAVLANFGIVCP